MAVASLESTKLRLVFNAGVDDEGKPILKSKTFNNVTKSATTDQLFQAAQAITVLCKDTLNKVERNDSIDLQA
ncbi:DUF1659 domain-containing protein [Neobacillus sp. NPDC097160]|uniref:DUF1659 domain-containing protein n=1 Tax=Neobacillus sp. NPDC097160 TaxID=3364298 RepID=UPI0037F759A7